MCGWSSIADSDLTLASPITLAKQKDVHGRVELTELQFIQRVFCPWMNEPVLAQRNANLHANYGVTAHI